MVHAHLCARAREVVRGCVRLREIVGARREMHAGALQMHAGAHALHAHLGKARVDDIDDAVDGNRSLGDVCREEHLHACARHSAYERSLAGGDDGECGG